VNQFTRLLRHPALLGALMGAGTAVVATMRQKRKRSASACALRRTPIAQPFADVAAIGYASILSIAPQRRIQRLVGRDLTLGSAVVATILTAGWPVLLNFGLILFAPRLAITSIEAFGWLVAYTALTAGMLASAWLTWRMIVVGAWTMDDLLGASPERPQLIDQWLRRRLRIGPQLLICLAVTALGLIVFYPASVELASTIQIRFVSYVAVAWTAFVGANVNYWLFTMAELPIRMYRCSGARFVWHDPATTPAVIVACDGWAFASVCVGAGVLSTELLAFLVPNRSGSQLLQVLSVVFPILAVLVAFYTTIQPFYTLHLMARRAQRATLRDLGEELERLSASDSVSDYRYNLELYRHVASAPSLPINMTTIVQYAAALLGVLAAYLLQRFIS
jgi:hypothetical protein